jgi:hypothetical protein
MDGWSTFELVDFLVTRGQHYLDEKSIKVKVIIVTLRQLLKTKCRRSVSDMENVYLLIMNKYLKRKHSQVLYACMQLIGIFFERSQWFRDKMLLEMTKILDVVFGLNGHVVPPPKSWIPKLHAVAVETLLNWKERFSDTIPQVKSHLLTKRFNSPLIMPFDMACPWILTSFSTMFLLDNWKERYCIHSKKTENVQCHSFRKIYH